MRTRFISKMQSNFFFSGIAWASALFLFGCDASKISESDLPSNQKILNVCVTPWDVIVADGAKVIAYESEKATCQETCKTIEYECRSGALRQVSPGPQIPIQNSKTSCLKEDRCGCALPNGRGRVSDGFEVEVFRQSRVSCGQSCDSVARQAVCRNGRFYDPANLNTEITSFDFTCEVDDCRSCNSPWDSTLRAPHGGQLTGFVNSTLACGLSCSDSTKNLVRFNCNNGELVRAPGAPQVGADLLKSTCEESKSCTCRTADGQTYTHDPMTTIQLTKKSIGTCDNGCDSKVAYTCKDGSFVNQVTGQKEIAALYTACTDSCQYCDFPDGRVKQGTQKKYFKKIEGTCTEECSSVEIRCDAGPTASTITKVSGVGLISEYTKTECSDTCVRCDLPNTTNKLIENQTITLFKASSVGCSATCQQGELKCDKATKKLVLITGDGVAADYTQSACVSTCVQCEFPDGTKMDAKNPPPSGRYVQRWAKDKVACGYKCSDHEEWLVCNSNGTVTRQNPNSTYTMADLKHTSCSMEPCKDCTLPWTNDVKLANNATVSVFQKNSVTCSERCDDFRVNLRCQDAGLIVTGGDASTNLATVSTSCSQISCPKCRFGNREFAEGEMVAAYKYDGTNCAVGACADYKTLTCKSGVWEGGDIEVYKNLSCKSSCAPPSVVETGRPPGDASAEGGGAFTWLCPVLHSRGFAWEGTTLSYYSKPKATHPDSCNNYRVEVKCDSVSGLFSNSTQMLYLHCKDQ